MNYEPAFPVIPPVTEQGHSAVGYPYPDPGMSLRAYFAAKALPWCLQEFGNRAGDQTQFAEAAVQIADRVIAELVKEPKT